MSNIIYTEIEYRINKEKCPIVCTCTDLRNEKAVPAFLKSKQLLPLDLGGIIILTCYIFTLNVQYVPLEKNISIYNND